MKVDKDNPAAVWNFTTTPAERRAIISDPLIAHNRKKLADGYRAMRKTDPRRARDIFKRMKEASQRVITDFWVIP